MLEDPRVEIRLADGRNHLFGTDQRFDAIVGDLFVPWHAGAGYLYTEEHFANVRERLAEGGVFVQWLQADQISAEEFRTVAATFSDVFEDAELWLNRTQPRRPLLGLVGFRDRPAAGPRPQKIDEMIRVCGAPVLRAWSASAPRNTDDFPRIEFSAASSHLVRTAADGRALLAASRSRNSTGCAWIAASSCGEQRRVGRPRQLPCDEVRTSERPSGAALPGR